MMKLLERAFWQVDPTMRCDGCVIVILSEYSSLVIARTVLRWVFLSRILADLLPYKSFRNVS